MTIVKVIPFEEFRLQAFKYNGAEKDYATKLDTEFLATSYAKLGISYMVLANGKLVAMGGVYQVLPGIGQAWMYANREVRKCKGAFFRAVKTRLDKIISDMQYKQVNMMCLEKSFEAKNLAEHLNFKKQMNFILYTKTGE